MREDVHRIAVEPTILWVDAQARADWLNFYDFDPVEGIGIDTGAWRRNPLIWKVRLRDMLARGAPEETRLQAEAFLRQAFHALDGRSAERGAEALCVLAAEPVKAT